MNTLTNAQIKQIKSLHNPKGRRLEGQFVVAGKKVVREAVLSGTVVSVLMTNAFKSREAAYLAALGFHGIMIEMNEYQASKLDPSSTASGVLAIVSAPTVSFSDVSTAAKFACLVDIQDPGNLGTMIRTADWFGVEAIILGAGSVDPLNEKVVAASMGSLFHLPLYVSHDLIADLTSLKKNGCTLIATTPHGTRSSVRSSRCMCVLMGGESRGLPEGYATLCSEEYTIPGGGKAESLNVAVSFGIALYALTTSK